MKTIKFQLVLGPGLPSKMIAYFGGGPGEPPGYSHVDCELENGNLVGARSDVIGSSKAGVQIRPPNYEKWLKRTRFELTKTLPGQYEAWEKFVLKQVGDPYDDADIFGFIFGHHYHTQGHWICSAMAHSSLLVCDVFKPWVPSTEVDPNTFAFMLNARHFTATDLPV